MQPSSQSETMRLAFRYQSALTSYAFGMLRDWSLAQDAVQEAFVVLVEKYEEVDPAQGVFPLLKKIVRFKVLEMLRNGRREVAIEFEELSRIVDETLDHALTEDEASLHNRRLNALYKCIAQIQSSMKKLLVAFYWKNQSCEQLAVKFGRSAPSLRTTLMRARETLRKCIDKEMKKPEVLS